MKKIRLYQTENGDKVKWLGRNYIIVIKDFQIHLRADDDKWDIRLSFGLNCKMWVELVMKNNPVTVGKMVAQN